MNGTAAKAKHKPHGPYEMCCKRPLDFICAFMALLLFWWLFAILAFLIRIKLGSPVIFCQERPGKDEKIFKLYKFRTMTDARDENGNLLPDDQRMTKFGKILRSASLDELPELLNILKGDMSVVGPRPLLVRYLPRYNDDQRHRHDVRPGLTGLAQASGDVDMTWEHQFELDVQYVNQVTLWYDIKIIFMTVKRVVLRNQHQYGDFFREEFRGSDTVEEL